MEKRVLREKELLVPVRKAITGKYSHVIPATDRGIAAAAIAAKACGAQPVSVPLSAAETRARAASGEFKGRNILIAVDSSVSGRTLFEAAKMLDGSGVKTFAIAGKADFRVFEEPFCFTIQMEKENIIKRLFEKWWFFIAGFGAFLWVALRSGTNPKRLSYPCQQAALPIAVTWAAGVAGFFIGGFFLRRYMKASIIVAAAVMSLYAAVNFPRYIFSAVTDPLPTWENLNPVAKIFVVDDCPQPAGSLEAGSAAVSNDYLNDAAVDRMVQLMDAKGQYFYKGVTAPGIFGANDVVIIKGNFQGFYRNATNTDRIKGVIWKILNHPEGFTGEIVVVDDTQLLWGNPVEGINQQDNNSYFINQSIVDVCNTFKAKGYPVDFRCWASISNVKVTEYSAGNMNEGYVQPGGLNSENWPKFTTPGGKYVSLRYGVWEGGAYNKDRLTVVNFPVLKAHDDFGAVTCGVKNWVGMLTCDAAFYNADRHGFFWAPNHLVARTHIIVRPKITFIDAEWVARTGPHNAGDVHSYAGKFLASTDPVAGDWYASSYILAQVAVNANNMNGSYVGGNTYNVLNSVAAYLNGQGVPATTNAAQMSVYAYRELVFTPTASPTAVNTWDPAIPTYTPTFTPTFVPIRINTGGPLYNDGVNNWLADKAYAAGSWGYTGGAGVSDRGGIAIAGTTDDVLYNTERYGSPSYTFDNIPNGTYEVTLKFAETWWGVAGMGGGAGTGARIFDVLIEGAEVITNLDIFAQVGANTALDFTRVVAVTDGQLNITMHTDVDGGLIDAIMIKPQAALTPSVTITNTATSTVTNISSSTNTATRTYTPSATLTHTLTRTHSSTPSATLTSTIETMTFTASPTFTMTNSQTASFTMTQTFTPVITNTMTATSTDTVYLTPTQTWTGTPPSATVTSSVTLTWTPQSTATNTATATRTATGTAQIVSTNTMVPVITATATATSTYIPSVPTQADTAAATPTNTATFAAVLSSTATPAPAATAEKLEVLNIKPYPNPYNPAEGQLGISYTTTKGTSAATLCIYTISYRLVMKRAVYADNTAGTFVMQVPAEMFSKAGMGVYIGVIEARDSGGASVKSKPVIILITR